MSMTPEQRRRRIASGKCLQCSGRATPGHVRCDRHIVQERKRGAARRRARGQLTMADYIEQTRTEAPPPRGPLTRVILDAKIQATARCGCGLLLPCYRCPSINDYAGARRYAE